MIIKVLIMFISSVFCFTISLQWL